MQKLAYLSRYVVGLIFVFSGFVKVIDPIGTAIKMEEYFEVFATDLSPIFGSLVPAALPIAVGFCILEVVLGIALLTGFLPRLTIGLLLATILFFSALTFYSAYYNKVTDCGCFGDFLKLRPWVSFGKDIALLVLILLMLVQPKALDSDMESNGGMGLTLLALLVSSWIAYHALNHLPLIDFRAYKVGNHLPSLMKLPPDAKPDVVTMTLVKGAETKVVTADQYASDPTLWQDTTWKVDKTETIPGDRPAISDYAVYDADGNNITEKTFAGTWFWIIILDAKSADVKRFDGLGALIDALRSNPATAKMQLGILTSSSLADVEVIRHEAQLAAPVYTCDATVLKTIMRSNPGTWMVKDGTVVGKWHYHDTPSVEQVTELLANKQ